MTESQASILEKAKLGEPQAIAALLNRNLQPKGIMAKASVKNKCFWIMLEGAKTPPQKQLVEFIRQAFTKLEVDIYATVKIYGKCLNEEIPDWHEDIAITPKVSLSPETLAKQGDVKAITMLIKQWLDISDIAVKVSKKDDCLLIMLASVEVPDQQQTSTKIQTELRKLEVESVTKLKIYGKQIGQEFPDWHIETDVKKVEEVLGEDNNTQLPEVAVLTAQPIEPVLVEPAESLPVKSPEFPPLPVKTTEANGYVLSNQIYDLINETCYQGLARRNDLEDGSIHDIAFNYIENLESDLRLDFDQFTIGVIDLVRTSKIQIEPSKIHNLMLQVSTYEFNVVRSAIRDLENITGVILSTEFPENDDLKNFFKGITDSLTNNPNSKSVQGAIIGGTIGSFFGPVVGTAIGSAIGAWIGGQMQAEDFREIFTRYDKFHSKLISEWRLFLKKVFRKLTSLIAEETSLRFLTYEAIEKSIELVSEGIDCADDETNLNLPKALNLFDQGIAINSGRYQIWNIKGNTLSKLERYEEAITSYDRALQLNPNLYYAWHNRGTSLFNLVGRKEEALTSYDRALQLNPDDSQAWSIRGDTLSSLGRNEQAIASYDRALQINPDAYEAWYFRGSALSDLGKNEEAISSYDRALQINPDLYYAWYNRGNGLHKLGRNEEAIASYDKALEIKPDYHKAWYNRGDVLNELDRHEEAINSYDKALEIKPDYHEALTNRGLALYFLAQ